MQAAVSPTETALRAGCRWPPGHTWRWFPTSCGPALPGSRGCRPSAPAGGWQSCGASVCMETRLSIWATVAASWMARLSWRVDSGSSGSRPGNSQPPSSILPWARAHAPPDPQALQQDGREHGIAVFATFALFHAKCHTLTVDVRYFERNHFADTQPGAVGN